MKKIYKQLAFELPLELYPHIRFQKEIAGYSYEKFELYIFFEIYIICFMLFYILYLSAAHLVLKQLQR